VLPAYDSRMLRYQVQDSCQTLAEGLAEYYAANEGIITRPIDLPPESTGLFLCHDMCHVIFGLDTTLVDEAMADVRTLLSCDVGAMRYFRYLRHDRQAQALFAKIGYGRSVRTTVRAIPRIARAFVEAFRMRRRWPWTPPASYVNRSIAELRLEYGIRVV
jgi:hypothetical protein